jgi:transcriptional regulator with XRE-family HTH domain
MAMGKLSDQIREAISACGTTRYALAKKVGIPESALSRFMAGKQGLTLATLDKLSDILGLEIITTVQRAQRPAPTGRKRKEKAMAVKQKKVDWQRAAYGFALDAHENFFSSRRGVWYVEDVNALCFYNNNPYAKHPTLRDEEVAEFRRRLKSAGIKELAYATYPPPGDESAGYTFAMIVDVGEDRMAELCDWWNEILLNSFRRMEG